MGSENSRAFLTIPEIPFPTTRSNFLQPLIYDFPFDSPSDPKFWFEYYLAILHLFDGNQKPSEKPIIPLSPRHLFELFYGCNEVLPNPVEILEAIIQKSIVKNRTSYTLSLLYELHQRYSYVRYVSYFLNRDFLFQANFLNDLRNSKGGEFSYDFGKFTNIISQLPKMFNPKKHPIKSNELEEIQALINTITNSIVPNEMSAPIDDYFANHTGQKFSFQAQNVYPHCISSNGQFLFILTDKNILYIFPLICNGSIIPPITRTLNFQIPVNQHFSIAASNTYLFVFSSKFKRIYRIADLLSSLENEINDHNTFYGLFNSRHTSTVNSTSQSKKSESAAFIYTSNDDNNHNANRHNSANNNSIMAPMGGNHSPNASNIALDIDSEMLDSDQSYAVSDGLILAQISGTRACKIKLYDYESRKILNYKSALKSLDFQRPVQLAPAAISGTFIAFISIIDQHTSIIRVYSLLTGGLISEEEFSNPDPIAAFTIDSLNHCVYVVISSDDGKMEVRRYSYIGSYNPFIFNYSIRVYNPSKKIKKKNAYKAVGSAFNLLMVQFMGSKIIPPVLLAADKSQFEVLINALKELAVDSAPETKHQSYYSESIQALSGFIDLNLRAFEVKKFNDNQDIDVSIVTKVIQLLPSLPSNIASFLFFFHFTLFFEIDQNKTIVLLKSLVENMTKTNLLTFCLNQLEKSETLAKIPFNSPNEISNLIPDKLVSLNSFSKNLRSLLYVHQHILISSTYSYFKQNPNESRNQIYFIDDEHETFSFEGNLNNQLDYFMHYAFVLIERFLTSISTKFTKTDLANSLNLKLFDNFCRTLSLLSNCYQIAQPITALLGKVIPKLAELKIDSNRDDKHLLSSVNFLYYIFAQYVSTLIKGAGKNDFEKDFYWLIKQNVNLTKKHDSVYLNNLASKEYSYFENDKIEHFIKNDFPKKEINSEKIMEIIYSKYKKQFNRKLTTVIQEFDRLVLISIAKHLNIIDEILAFNDQSTVTKKLKPALDQMIRIRSVYRQAIQKNADVSNLIIRALLLCRLSTKEADARKLGEFISSDNDPMTIVNSILILPSRIQITIAGFSLLSRLIDINTVNDSFLNCVSDCLSSIRNFSGFGSLMMSANLTEKQKGKIFQFFSSLLTMYKKVGNSQLVLIAFRFFKSLNALKSLQGKLFIRANKILRESVNDLPLFSVVYLLVKHVNKVISRHGGLEMTQKELGIDFDVDSPINWLLLSAYLETNQCSEGLFNVMTKKFWSCCSIHDHDLNDEQKRKTIVSTRPICRAIYNALIFNCEEPILKETTVSKFFRKSFRFISKQLLICDFKQNEYVIELILLLRKIINCGNQGNNPFISILYDMMNTRKHFKATLSIIGLQIDFVRPYVTVRQNFKQKIEEFDSRSRENSIIQDDQTKQSNNNISSNVDRSIVNYISIPSGKDLVYIPLPFSLSVPPRNFKFSEVHAFPLIEVNDDVLKEFSNYILSFSDFSSEVSADALSGMKNRNDKRDLVVQNLFIQTLSYNAIRADFVNGISKNYIKVLSSKMELFTSIQDTFQDAIKDISMIKVVDDDIDGFYKIQGDTFNSYLTKPLISNEDNNKLSFSIQMSTADQDNELYFGIVSDCFHQYNVRYELIHYPSGTHYPIGLNLLNMDLPISIQIDADNRIFIVNDITFQFPIGDQFRFLIATKASKKNSVIKPIFHITNFDKNIAFFHKAIDNDASIDLVNDDHGDDDENADSQLVFDEHSYYLRDAYNDNIYNSKTHDALPDLIVKVNNFDPGSLRSSVLSKQLIPVDYNDVPHVSYTLPFLAPEEKMNLYYIEPPENLPLHIFNTKKSSKHLKRVIWNSYISHLTGQFATICLMRIALINPYQLIIDEGDLSNISNLFMNILLSIEPYHTEFFSQHNFFFNLDSPIWKLESSLSAAIANQSAGHQSGYESEAIEALNTLINMHSESGGNDQFGFEQEIRKDKDQIVIKEKIYQEIINGLTYRINYLASRPFSHLFAVQNHYVHLYTQSVMIDEPSSQEISEHEIDKFKSVDFTMNSLVGSPKFQKVFLTTNSNKKIELPLFVENSSKKHLNFSIFKSILRKSDMLVLNVDQNDNLWMKNTIFEMFLLLKDLMYLINDSRHRILIKNILIELYISESPFIRPFLMQFAKALQYCHPFSPLDCTDDYLKRLALLATYLKSSNPENSNDTLNENIVADTSMSSLKYPDQDLNEFFKEFYRVEQRTVNNSIHRSILSYFPEFFSIEDNEKISQINSTNEDNGSIFIKKVFIDPGAMVTADEMFDEIFLLTNLSKHYDSIIGFPFWDILPYYYRLLTYDENDSKCKDFIEPTLYKNSNGIVVIDNPTGTPIHIAIKLLNGSFNAASVLMYSVSPLFEVADYVTKDNIDDVITVKEGKTYFSMTGFRGTWEIKFIDAFLKKKRKNSNLRHESLEDEFIEIDINKIKETFTYDMNMFAIEWSNDDTQVLLNAISSNAMKNKRFDAIKSIAESCTQLNNKFSPMVVKLRALFLHHFNYILSVESNQTDPSTKLKSKRILRIPVEIKMKMKEWISNEEASKSLFDAIKCNESYREITINRFLSKKLVEGNGRFCDSIIGQLAIQFNRFDPSLFRNKAKPWTVVFADEKAIDAGGPMRELMTEVAKSIFQPSSEIFCPVKEFFVPFIFKNEKTSAQGDEQSSNQTNENESSMASVNQTARYSIRRSSNIGANNNIQRPVRLLRAARNRRSSVATHNHNNHNTQNSTEYARNNSNLYSGGLNMISPINKSGEFTYEFEHEMKMMMYRAVGQFIGIIVRTGFPQNLPFAPLVWKYIAEGRITREDVFQSDVAFASEIKTMLSKPEMYINSPQVQLWETTQWDGKVVTLPQHVSQSQAVLNNQTDTLVESNINSAMVLNSTLGRSNCLTPQSVAQVNIYVNECVQYRIDSILPILKEIRKGFTENVGFEFNPILSGPLLMHLANGSDIITVEQLKSLTVVLGFDADDDQQYIDRFWRVVERLTSSQRHLMLRFITTLTRIPITVQTQFEIKIDKYAEQSPDSVLPTASTCFNKLHWPCYSTDDIAYAKLCFAVENCHSLDLT